MMPGSQKVWWRDSHETVHCNRSFCRHATVYHDGVVVNHAPAGQTVFDGAINGQLGRSEQLVAFTFLTWLMSDANMLEAVVNPPSWPNHFSGAFVKPTLLVASAWKPYNWTDPALSISTSRSRQRQKHAGAKPFPPGPFTQLWDGTIFVAVSIFLWWFCSTAWQRRRLHSKQQEARQGIVLEAET